MDMNLGTLAKLGFIERRADVILEGPLLDLMMDTDVLKERIINGALADVFKRAPARLVAVSDDPLLDADLPDDLSADIGEQPDAGDEPVSGLPH